MFTKHNNILVDLFQPKYEVNKTFQLIKIKTQTNLTYVYIQMTFKSYVNLTTKNYEEVFMHSMTHDIQRNYYVIDIY